MRPARGQLRPGRVLGCLQTAAEALSASGGGTPCLARRYISAFTLQPIADTTYKGAAASEQHARHTHVSLHPADHLSWLFN